MSLRKNISGHWFEITGAILSLALTSAGMCQTAAEKTVELEYVDTLEEIIVYGDRSLHLLREDTIKAEEAVFTAFNALNGDDEFDIYCIEEARTGTRIKTRWCRANFVRNVTSHPRHSGFIKSRRLFGPYIPDWAGVAKKHRQLEAEMEALATEHPELLDALVAYAIAKETLKIGKRKKCQGKGIICNK